MRYRTDLAVESREICQKEQASSDEIEGVAAENLEYGEDIKVTRIKILNEVGAKKLEKPQGTYVTLEVDGIADEKEGIKERAGKALAEELKKMVEFNYRLKVLVTGLGSDKVTPDSLGPYTASKVKVTGHLFRMFDADGDEEMANVSCLIPGVTGSTGLEAAELVKSAADLCGADVIIAVDSLAARDIERVSTTIQINDTGISPGGGMGNQRAEISKKTAGRKVIAIGVPTVIDSRTIVRDALFENSENEEKIEEYIKEKGRDMIVTSTDIDQIIKDFSDIIANGINKTLHPGIYS